MPHPRARALVRIIASRNETPARLCSSMAKRTSAGRGAWVLQREMSEMRSAASRRLCTLEQSNKACLFEMAVGRQRLADAQLLHYSEAGAINQAPFFVLSLRE